MSPTVTERVLECWRKRLRGREREREKHFRNGAAFTRYLFSRFSHLPASNLAPASMQTLGCSFCCCCFFLFNWTFFNFSPASSSPLVLCTSQKWIIISAAYAIHAHSSRQDLALCLQHPSKTAAFHMQLKVSAWLLCYSVGQHLHQPYRSQGDPFVTPRGAYFHPTVCFSSSDSVICTSRAGDSTRALGCHHLPQAEQQPLTSCRSPFHPSPSPSPRPTLPLLGCDLRGLDSSWRPGPFPL